MTRRAPRPKCREYPFQRGIPGAILTGASVLSRERRGASLVGSAGAAFANSLWGDSRFLRRCRAMEAP